MKAGQCYSVLSDLLLPRLVGRYVAWFAKSFKNKTTNNILPRTGDESSLPIIALGAVIGLAGIGAALRRYE